MGDQKCQKCRYLCDLRGFNLLSAVGVPKLIYRTGVVLDLPPERHTSPHHMYNYVQGAPDP